MGLPEIYGWYEKINLWVSIKEWVDHSNKSKKEFIWHRGGMFYHALVPKSLWKVLMQHKSS